MLSLVHRYSLFGAEIDVDILCTATRSLKRVVYVCKDIGSILRDADLVAGGQPRTACELQSPIDERVVYHLYDRADSAV